MPSTKLLRGLAPLLSKTPSATARPSLRKAAVATSSSVRHIQTGSSRISPRRPLLTPSSTPRFTYESRRSIFIQTESTPNSDALKFLPNHPVLPPTVSVPYIEYLNPRSTISPPYPSPLAAQLMNIDGVTSVFYGSDFITVTKAADAVWAHIRPEVFALITEAITSGQPLVNVSEAQQQQQADGEGEKDSLSYDENDSEVVGMIKELLETRIRPAIQEDGGDIEFRGFENGQVLLKLRGACRTCDSSTVTLKSGIEGMLMHYIEEVQGVQQVLDEEEEIAIKEFAKFEEKLKQQKASQGETASTA
ncbi:hypothetical protein QBC35DRAFT_491556 [Podospora australis]|uniref:Scaffold protein Nfu/NifU N-terminal domain-containing protein n=1 Tax=Podospora australis TaxID=1536484 RepID=A0AAN6WX98_9PEZI|nr:hypothetical protein QBC35DRAFT_491556 [Podospora australis]